MSTEPEQTGATPIPDCPAPAPIAAPTPKQEKSRVGATVKNALKEAAASKKQRKNKAVALLIDSLMVGVLAAAIGTGAWYLNKELEKVRVPGPMEEALALQGRLCAERDALQEKAYHADEQLQMRRKLAALVQRSADLKRSIEEKTDAVEKGHQQVLALQHDIRQEDKTSRSVAKSLLPGLPIGDAATTTGKLHRNAVIHRLEGNKISLRTPEGQVRFPLRELVKDTLPDIARYAFGIDDLVDMSDFELQPGAPAPKPRKGKLITPAAPKAEAAAPAETADYEAAPGAPVVDTDAAHDSSIPTTADDFTDPAPQQNNWDMPTGDLPL